MDIESVHIRNFRKLRNCHIDFGKKETVFVGANNSGKTSAISAIVWFLKNTEKFTLKEFTATNWSQIDVLGKTRYKMFQDGVKISQFVDNGRVLTIEELNEILDE